jgi:hypothetical protein
MLRWWIEIVQDNQMDVCENNDEPSGNIKLGTTINFSRKALHHENNNSSSSNNNNNNNNSSSNNNNNNNNNNNRIALSV